MASKKDWLPKEGQPFVILEDLPDGSLSLQSPDIVRCPPAETIEGCFKHECTQTNWPGGKNFVEDEQRRQRQWEEMTDEKYEQAGRYFEWMEESQTSPSLKKSSGKARLSIQKEGKGTERIDWQKEQLSPGK